MELAPFSLSSSKIKKVSLDNSAPLQGIRPLPGKREDGFYDYLLESDRDGEATFLIDWEKGNEPENLPTGVQVTLNLVPTGDKNLLQNSISIDGVAEKSAKAHFLVKQIKEGKYETCFALEARFQKDANNPPFWITFSSDNTYEAPERLYGLQSVIETVLKDSFEKSIVQDYIHFRMERN